MKPCLPLFLLFTACTAPTSSSREPVRTAADTHPWDAPPLEHSVAVHSKGGERLELDELYARLAEADVVFLGETHLDETTHRLELGVLEAMLARRDSVVLALEMFERDVQSVLDRYLAGEIDEAAFLEQSRPWSNYRTAYRPLIEAARCAGAPIVASNFPRPLRMEVMRSGLEALDTLEGDARRQAPEKILANSSEYHRRTDNAVRGHIGMMGGPADPDDPRLTSTQTLWDNAMGAACARALEENPGAQVVHVNGSFHSAYWDGTVRQCRLRAPDANILTVAIVPTRGAARASWGGTPIADFVVFAESGPSDVNDGRYSVLPTKELDYALHVPDGADDAPLLVWLSGDGLTADDGLALWRSRLGDECALAVFEPLYRELQDDQSQGGRWFWADTFEEDRATLGVAIESAIGYLLRHFPIDPGRVVLAGEGTGGTVAIATALLAELDLRAVALAPRQYSKLKDIPLPLPEYLLRIPEKSLRVLGDADDEGFFGPELEAYTGARFPSSFTRASDDPWASALERENTLRAALGLVPREAPSARAHVVVPGDSRRARHWARIAALGRDARVAVLEEEPAADAGSRSIPLTVDREALARGEGLPRCPGPFGGTTVLVVPADELADWLPLEEEDPLNAASRFHRVRIATEDGERGLGDVLLRLAEENRTNVLVLPARFCADGELMRRLVRGVADHADRMTIHWLPGLGGT